SLGHRHPNVLKAIKDQLEKHLHVMVYGEFIQSPQSRFAKLLCDQLPEMLDRVYFVNSGTESVEGALKLAKKFTGRSKFVAFQNSYHGDTHGSLSVTGRNVYRDPYQPLLPNVYFSDFNSDEVFDLIDDETAALIMEPIQGEGGIIPAEKEWLQEVRRRCDETGALLIFDEIQTGFYRTGSLFAFQYYDVVPDIMCLAKAMAGGMPMGAFVSSSEIFEVFKKDPPLNHVTTFGGHPVSCAAAYASLKTLLSDDFAEKAMKIEKIVRSVLKGDGIVEVRGRGAMLGLQLQDSDLTQKVVKHCFERGIILGWTLHSNSLIRIAPPLIIDQELLVDSLQVIIEAIREYL
ncbi:MAG: aminotransferase class III-fold pyridoxal phosphate-dependent enzyme, partial [Bacteroidetes bacterium]|nr:aminotransferase class III-fold pyridoxal phosphate-dependent enzyme [Bacteroidota bacterium]